MSGNDPLNFDDVALSDAQREFVRILKMALLEDETCASVLLAGLQSADKEALPTEPEELLDFARAHLTEPLTKEIGAHLTRALISELSAEMQNAGTSARSPSSSALNVNTPHVAVPVRPPPKEVIGRLSFPKFRQSVAILVRTASMRIRVAVASAKIPVAPAHDGHRPHVLFVHPDRVVRASIARALVNARFDVSVFDTTPQLIPELKRQRGSCLAILDIWEKGVEATLRTLVAANPEVRILAWTDIEPTVAESVLTASGVKGFVVRSKTGAEIELVDGVRQLARASSG